ncbi:MAG: hypothetical protein EXS64_12365 [Candidatus Latescibacteria bacterium]|nr:hypothetical protein [Candidatus Latescibacterota bacterium]
MGEGLTRPPVLLRLYDATARIALPDAIEIEAFVAATRNLIVLRIRSQSPLSLPAMLELCHESSIPRYAPAELLGTDGLPYPRVATESRVLRGGATPHAWHDGPFRYLQQNLSASLSAVLCGFVYGARSHSVVRENAVLVTFDVPPSGECLILVGVATAQDGPDPALRARAEVERALPHGYLLLQREHAVWWERFWETAESASAAGDVDYRNLYLSRATPHGV